LQASATLLPPITSLTTLISSTLSATATSKLDSSQSEAKVWNNFFFKVGVGGNFNSKSADFGVC